MIEITYIPTYPLIPPHSTHLNNSLPSYPATPTLRYAISAHFPFATSIQAHFTHLLLALAYTHTHMHTYMHACMQDPSPPSLSRITPNQLTSSCPKPQSKFPTQTAPNPNPKQNAKYKTQIALSHLTTAQPHKQTNKSFSSFNNLI